MNYSNLFVCLMGMGTVFFGLICLVALTYLVGWIGQRTGRKSPAVQAVQPAAAAETREERERVAAAVSAALAEELGTDITGIRIISMKKV